MPYIEVEVDLDKFDDAELLAEVTARKLSIEMSEGSETHQLITNIWLKRRLSVSYEKDIDDLIYHVLGRVA